MSFNKEKYEVMFPENPKKPYFSQFSSDSIGAKKYAEALKEYEDKLPAYNEALNTYHKMDSEMYNLFKKDALENSGFNTHPKADAIFEYAWCEAHSYGYYSVWNLLEELSEVFNP